MTTSPVVAPNAPPDAPLAGDAHPATSVLRAWCYLVWFCLVRQARLRQMVWIALALLGLVAVLVTLPTIAGRWGMGGWRWRWVAPGHQTLPLSGGPGRQSGWNPPRVVDQTFDQTAAGL